MWPGIRPATGWMPKFTSAPLAMKLGGQFLNRVLRLSDGHAIAGNNQDVLRRFQYGIGVFHGYGLGLTGESGRMLSRRRRNRNR